MFAYPPVFRQSSSNLLRGLVGLAVAYTGLTLAVQVIDPKIGRSVGTPLEVALWIAIIAGLASTFIQLLSCGKNGRLFNYWLLAMAAVASIAILHWQGWTSGLFLGDLEVSPAKLEYFGNASLAIVVVAALMVLARLPERHVWLKRALLAIIAFQILALLFEFTATAEVFSSMPQRPGFAFTTELAELLSIEFYVVAVAMIGIGSSADPATAAASAVLTSLPAAAVGTKMRLIFDACGSHRRYIHPPVRLAYYPVFREITVGLVTVWLACKAGPGIKAETGKPVWRQAQEMIRLWFVEGIDPPSYYAQEFYRPERLAMAGEYLTRFETKNGLLGALNKMRKSPYAANEMGHKQLFDACCEKLGISHPRLLMSIESGHATLHCGPEELRTDMFCKLEKGMGAVGTLAFRNLPPDRYEDEEGKTYDLKGLAAHVAAKSEGKTMLVQPWLKNHPDIADLAKDSLITFRVVTCLNEQGRPEVTLAMLRVLAKLEPDWPQALDEEYAAPIDLVSGKMGLFTGDNMTTSHLRYERQPLTGSQVANRIVKQWPAIRDLALKAHEAFMHRVLIGWDIALTPQGPSVLEGNKNLDVMFLQRVHDLPAGRTRLGELVSFHLDVFAATLDNPSAG